MLHDYDYFFLFSWHLKPVWFIKSALKLRKKNHINMNIKYTYIYRDICQAYFCSLSWDTCSIWITTYRKYCVWLILAPTAPRNLKLTVESSTSIKVSWTKPLKINGVFKRYVVMYGLSKDSLSKSFYSFTTEYSLAPLDEFTTYYVQVHAETSVTGLSSDIISARTNEDG